MVINFAFLLVLCSTLKLDCFFSFFFLRSLGSLFYYNKPHTASWQQSENRQECHMTQWSNPTTPFPFCWLQTHKHTRSWSQLINRARMLPTARPACQPVIKENASTSIFAPRTICIQNIALHSCLSRSGLQSFHLKHEGSRQAALWQPNADDCKYKEGAMVRLTASIIEQKGLSDGLAGWLAWQRISTTAAAAAPASHNNCWLGSWSQLLAVSQQPVCSTPLIYVH